MSDKGRKQEERSSILNSLQCSAGGIPPMGTTPTLVHHAGPTYTLHSHPLAAYGMMRPVATPLTMQPTLGGGKGHPTAYSNDLGPPIFMPSLNLGTPKPAPLPPSFPSSGGPSSQPPKNCVSQASMTLMSEMLSTPPAPFQPLTAYHAHTSALRGPQQALYMTAPTMATPTHIQVHHMSGAGVMAAGKPPTISQGGGAPPNVTIAKPIPIPVSNPQKVAGYTKVVPSAPKVVPASHQRVSYPAASTSAPRRGAMLVKSQPPTSWHSPAELPSVSMATLSTMGLHAHALSGKPNPSSSLDSPPEGSFLGPHLVRGSAAPLGGVSEVPGHAGGGASTLSKMLSAPSVGVRVQKPGGEAQGSKSGGAPTSAGVLDPTKGPAPSTSGQASSSAVSSADTRMDRPPHPSASGLTPQPPPPSLPAHTPPLPPPPGGPTAPVPRDRATSGTATTAEMASNLIIVHQGLTGKHISQITNNNSVQQSTAGYTTSSGSGLSGTMEPLQSTAVPFHGELGQETEGLLAEQFGDRPSLHTHLVASSGRDGTTSPVAGPQGGKLVQAVHVPVGVASPAHSSSLSNGAQGSPLSHPMSSPGAGPVGSSPRPRILRKRQLDGALRPGAPPDPPSLSSSSSSSSSSLRPPTSPTFEAVTNHVGGARLDGTDYMTSPRKKPRKQNVVANDDQYAYNVPDDILRGSPVSPSPSLPHSSPTDEEDRPAVLTRQRSRVKSEGTESEAVEAPDRVIRFLSQLRQSPYPINGVYRVCHKAAHNHFRRYADIKHRVEDKVSVYDIAADSSSVLRASGWKLRQFGKQLADMTSVENEILLTMQSLLEDVQQLCCGPSSRGEEGREEREAEGKAFTELIQGNIDRCSRTTTHLSETKATIAKVLDHKPRVLEFLQKYSSERSDSPSSLSVASHKSHS